MNQRNIRATGRQGHVSNQELEFLDKGAGTVTFILFGITMGSVLLSAIWLLSTVAGGHVLSLYAIYQALMTVLPAGVGSGFCALATWASFKSSRTEASDNVFGYGAMCAVSSVIAVGCWAIALTFVLAEQLR
jgi:hypothetical protein